MTARCWWCGVEPLDRREITTFGDIEPVYLLNWPKNTDHRHRETVPGPFELLEDGRLNLRVFYD